MKRLAWPPLPIRNFHLIRPVFESEIQIVINPVFEPILGVPADRLQPAANPKPAARDFWDFRTVEFHRILPVPGTVSRIGQRPDST